LSERKPWYDATGLDLEPDTVVEVITYWKGPARAFEFHWALYGRSEMGIHVPGKLDRIEVKRAE